jgi:hypothetical protein
MIDFRLAAGVFLFAGAAIFTRLTIDGLPRGAIGTTGGQPASRAAWGNLTLTA